MAEINNDKFRISTVIVEKEINTKISTPRLDVISVCPEIKVADGLIYKSPLEALEIYLRCAKMLEVYLYPYHQACICCRKMMDYDKELEIISVIYDKFYQDLDDYTRHIYEKRKNTVIRLIMIADKKEK